LNLTYSEINSLCICSTSRITLGFTGAGLYQRPSENRCWPQLLHMC
jgi:hypothetical protein